MYKPCDGQFLDIGFVQKVKQAKQNLILKIIGWNIKSTKLKSCYISTALNQKIYFLNNKPSLKKQQDDI